MYADTDSIKVGDPAPSSRHHSKDEVDRLIEKARSLLDTPDPWDGITDEDIDYTSSYPSIDEILQWVADREERKKHGPDRANL